MFPDWPDGNVTSHEDVGISVALIVCILYFCDHYSPDHTAFSARYYIAITLLGIHQWSPARSGMN